MARSADPMSYATVVAYVYCSAIPSGVLTADDRRGARDRGCPADCRTIR